MDLIFCKIIKNWKNGHLYNVLSLPTLTKIGLFWVGFDFYGMKILNIIAGAVLLLLAAFFYYFVNQNAVNVPFFDDFSFIKYVSDLRKTDSLWSFLQYLELKHNGHGIGVVKFVFWLDALIKGPLNFRTLIVAGSLMIIGLWIYFYKILKDNELSFFYSLPVGLFLFTPAYYENIFWAMVLWQHIASIVIGILTYYFLAQSSRWSLGLAVVLGYLLTYTNGNGLAGMYVGLLIPLLQMRYWRALGWLVACVAISGAFYWYYPFPVGFGSANQTHTLQGYASAIVSFFGSVGYYFRGHATDSVFLGTSLAVALFGGLTILGVTFLFQFWKTPKTISLLRIFANSPLNLSLLALLGLLAITGLGVAATRASEGGAPRYMIYATVTIVATYVAVLLVLPRRFRLTFGLITTGLGVVFVVGAYLFAVPNVINFRKSLLSDVYSLRHHRRLSSKLELMENPYTLADFNEALARGLYVFPKNQLDAVLPFSKDVVVDTTLHFEVKYTATPTVYGNITTYKIRNKDLLFDQSDPENGIYLLLKETKTSKVYVNAPLQNANRNRNAFLKTGQYFVAGFEGNIYQGNIPDGLYQIGVLIFDKPKRKMVYSNQTLEIKAAQR